MHDIVALSIGSSRQYMWWYQTALQDMVAQYDY